MQRMISAGILFLLVASSGAQASNMYTTVVNDLRKKGVPEDCLSKVTNSDAAKIRSWHHDPETSAGSANRLTKALVEKICAR